MDGDLVISKKLKRNWTIYWSKQRKKNSQEKKEKILEAYSLKYPLIFDKYVA